MKHPLKHLRSKLDRMSITELNAAIATVETWKKQAIAACHAKTAREAKRTRVVDTRRKALLGGFVLFRIASSTDAQEIATARTWLRRQLPAFLTRTIDQVLLGDLIGDGAPPAQPDAPTAAKAVMARDTRRKILVGALILDRLESGDAEERGWLTTWVRAELPPFLTRKTDKALLADLMISVPPPSSLQAKEHHP